jgi:hypothetical protein
MYKSFGVRMYYKEIRATLAGRSRIPAVMFFILKQGFKDLKILLREAFPLIL